MCTYNDSDIFYTISLLSCNICCPSIESPYTFFTCETKNGQKAYSIMFKEKKEKCSFKDFTINHKITEMERQISLEDFIIFNMSR